MFFIYILCFTLLFRSKNIKKSYIQEVYKEIQSYLKWLRVHCYLNLSYLRTGGTIDYQSGTPEFMPDLYFSVYFFIHHCLFFYVNVVSNITTRYAKHEDMKFHDMQSTKIWNSTICKARRYEIRRYVKHEDMKCHHM